MTDASNSLHCSNIVSCWVGWAVPECLQWQILYLLTITWRLRLHHCFTESEKILANHRKLKGELGKHSQRNSRARETCLITGFNTYLKLSPDSSKGLWRLTIFMSELGPSVEWISSDLEFFFESLALLWIWNQVKPGSFDRIPLIYFFSLHTSILKVKVWLINPYGVREKKLHASSLAEGRSNI